MMNPTRRYGELEPNLQGCLGWSNALSHPEDNPARLVKTSYEEDRLQNYPQGPAAIKEGKYVSFVE